MICEECSIVVSALYCLECDQALCPDCSVLIHSRGRRQQHMILEKCQSCKYQALFKCMTCQHGVCQNCQFTHLGHYLCSQYKNICAGIFIDLDFCGAQDFLSILQCLRKIELTHNIGFIKGYSEFNPPRLTGIELRGRDTLAVDLSFETEGIGLMILVSEKCYEYTSVLSKIQEKIPGLAIFIATEIWPFKPVLLSQEAQRNMRSVTQVETAQSITRDSEEVVNSYLQRKAEDGQIVSTYEKILKHVSKVTDITDEKLKNVMKKMVSEKLILKTVKRFGLQKKVILYSLYAQSVTEEFLMNLLKSIKNDEMYPSERNILYRIKEFYHFKPKNWRNVVAQFKADQSSVFQFMDITDPITRQSSVAIYFKQDIWKSYENRKHQNLINTQLWKEFVNFMEDYFKPINGLKLENDTRPIPGGRYGCAQFVKLFGTKPLQKCSLGLLSSFVQLSINQNYLRYFKTLLIWTSTYICQEETDQMRIRANKIKEYILEMINEAGVGGISMSHLPKKLKKALGYKINVMELGYAKLKDLVLTLPGVSVEVRENNHSYAMIDQTSAYSENEVIEMIIKAIQPYKMGILDSELLQMLQEQAQEEKRLLDINDIAGLLKKSNEGRVQIYNFQDRTYIKKADCVAQQSIVEGFKNFLMQENEFSLFTSQEFVSMTPYSRSQSDKRYDVQPNAQLLQASKSYDVAQV